MSKSEKIPMQIIIKKKGKKLMYINNNTLKRQYLHKKST